MKKTWGGIFVAVLMACSASKVTSPVLPPPPVCTVNCAPPPTSMPAGSPLGAESGYALLAGAGETNAGVHTLIAGGNVGSWPTGVQTGFGAPNFTAPAAIDNVDAKAAQAAALVDYNLFAGRSYTALSASSAILSNLGNGATKSTYVAGYYSAGSSMDIPLDITLDAKGDANAVFVFKAGSTIGLESNRSVHLVNGAKAGNVVWIAGSSVTLVGTTSSMVGDIFAAKSITLGGGALNGRAIAGVLSATGAITIAAATQVVSAP